MKYRQTRRSVNQRVCQFVCLQAITRPWTRHRLWRFITIECCSKLDGKVNIKFVMDADNIKHLFRRWYRASVTSSHEWAIDWRLQRVILHTHARSLSLLCVCVLSLSLLHTWSRDLPYYRHVTCTTLSLIHTTTVCRLMISCLESI